jgi:fructokinase
MDRPTNDYLEDVARGSMTSNTRYQDIPAFVTKDGSIIRELMHPVRHACRAQSLAEAIVYPGRATALHLHHRTEELTRMRIRSCSSWTKQEMRIGIDLGGTKIEGIALDDTGVVLYRERIQSPRGDYAVTVAAITRLVQTIEARTGSQGTVGVGIPGALSPVTDRVKNANSTWLIGRPLHKDLQEQLQREVRIANDANCFAVSEATDGAGAGAQVVFGVILGTGTGGGICVQGRTLLGANAIAGEWGHNPLPWLQPDELPGAKCYCGHRGCVETWLSGPGFSAHFFEQTGRRLGAAEIVGLAEQGDHQAEQALQRYEDRLARALAGVINVLDPDVIVLGGGMSNIGRLYETVPQLWGRYVFSDHIATRLLSPVHGDSSGVRGAAWLW